MSDGQRRAGRRWASNLSARLAVAIATEIAAEVVRTLRVGLDLVLPRVCPGCFAAEPWCADCASTISGRPRSVTIPDAMLDEFSSAGLALPTVHTLTRYVGPIRAAIVAAKERGRRDLPPVLGVALGRGLAALQDVGVLPADLWLVPAPTRLASARARGGDPVTAMARAAAAELAAAGRSTGVAPCLYLARGTRDSVGLDAAGRAANLARAVRFRPEAAPPPRASVVLLDDVLTSGATVNRSSMTLFAHSLVPVGALVLAAVPPLRPEVVHGMSARSKPSQQGPGGGRQHLHGRFGGVPGSTGF